MIRHDEPPSGETMTYGWMYNGCGVTRLLAINTHRISVTGGSEKQPMEVLIFKKNTCP